MHNSKLNNVVALLTVPPVQKEHLFIMQIM